ncbi:MAG: hypothetical protein V4585_15135 [Bacteroidota bacterium]|jgi:hypothetical protein
MITTFNLEINKTDFEIFPKEIWNNPNIAFHGTTELYSQLIETNGFSENMDIVSIKTVEELIKILELPEIKSLDKSSSSNIDTSLMGIFKGFLTKKTFQVYLSYLSLYCAWHSLSQKGGQIFHYIREIEELILQVKKKDSSFNYNETSVITEVFKLANSFTSFNSVVYAIDLSKVDYKDHGYFIICNSIPVNTIIGKIIIDKTFNEESILKIGTQPQIAYANRVKHNRRRV